VAFEVFSVRFLESLLERVKEIKGGLDASVIEKWFRVVESEARSMCPKELAKTIEVLQDPVLKMRFEVRASRRAAPYLIIAIEKYLDMMPFATRLYFMKVGEIIEEKLREYDLKTVSRKRAP